MQTAPAQELQVRVRASVPTDLRFVVDSWRESWRLSKRNRRLPQDAYDVRFRNLVTEGVLAEPDTRIVVACDASDPDVILAWLCYTPGVPTAHFAYTRKELRRGGLFSILLHAVGVRDGLVYTSSPQEHSHRLRNRPMGIEQALLAAAKDRQIATRYVPLVDFLGRVRKR